MHPRVHMCTAKRKRLILGYLSYAHHSPCHGQAGQTMHAVVIIVTQQKSESNQALNPGIKNITLLYCAFVVVSITIIVFSVKKGLALHCYIEQLNKNEE